jgi:hypothetical protein
MPASLFSSYLFFCSFLHISQEWLATGNMLRQIYDLSNLERDEFAVAGSGGSNGAAAGAAANAAIASASGQPMHGITGAGANQDGAKEKVMLSL